MINHRLVWFLESHKLLTSVQCEFRARRSTVGHLVCFETFVREAFVHNQHMVSIRACPHALCCHGQFDHDSKECKLDTTCCNCKGAHFVYSREFPKWKLEKEVQKVMICIEFYYIRGM